MPSAATHLVRTSSAIQRHPAPSITPVTTSKDLDATALCRNSTFGISQKCRNHSSADKEHRSWGRHDVRKQSTLSIHIPLATSVWIKLPSDTPVDNRVREAQALTVATVTVTRPNGDT
ncbi:hypothetical protein ED733_001630 [Metarhizium rileyi]|uniref:Uncharacterized protein n=1 Tax=Metarhizium rileyi (strain RCEF 4871) TaxID=1649241 RepID=A0A5C6FZF1_METRR|nr:hypothetical protein ED733_001630 [Metarhizium rileyi]